MQTTTKEINALQAEFCAAVGDPTRVRIIYKLAKGPRNVKNLAKAIGLSPSATSRHLAVLKNKELVVANRDGHKVIYSLAAPRLVEVLNIVIEILNQQFAQRANIIQMERYNEGS